MSSDTSDMNSNIVMIETPTHKPSTPPISARRLLNPYEGVCTISSDSDIVEIDVHPSEAFRNPSCQVWCHHCGSSR